MLCRAKQARKRGVMPPRLCWLPLHSVRVYASAGMCVHPRAYSARTSERGGGGGGGGGGGEKMGETKVAGMMRGIYHD